MITSGEHPPVLSLRDLRVTFATDDGALRAVDGISLDVGPNETLGVVGESGAGKSVMALTMMGLTPRGASVRGEVLFGGRDVLRMSEAEASSLRGARIAIVMQEAFSALNPVYTIGHQVSEAISIHNRHREKREVRKRVIELLRLVGISEPVERAACYPYQLSGGMAQRVVLAMALANDPAILIADEPTSALDVTIQAHVLDVLRRVRSRTSTGIVLITHDLGVVAGLADRVAVIYAGRVVECAAVDEVFGSPSHPYTRALLGAVPRVSGSGATLPAVALPGTPPSMLALPPGCAFHPRCPRARVPDPCATTTPQLAMVGDRATADAAGDHLAACHFAGAVSAAEANGGVAGAVRSSAAHAPTSEAPRSLLEVRDLVKHFGGPRLRPRQTSSLVHAVCGVSFAVQRAETLCLVGESGCGKTTTARLVLGLVSPTSGTIRMNGENIAHLRGRRLRAVRHQMQAVFQDPESSLNPRRTVGQSVALPLRVHGSDARLGKRHVANLMDLVGLQRADADRFPHELSGGQRQRVCIARALALEPALVVLDEPVSALDVSVRAGIVRLLRDVQERTGTAYLLVAHDLAMVRDIADRVAVMYLGRVVEVGTRDDIFESASHPYTQGLLSAIPVPDPAVERHRDRILLSGDLPSSTTPPSGCRFRTRCWKAQEICAREEPKLVERGQGHPVACHFADAEAAVMGRGAVHSQTEMG